MKLDKYNYKQELYDYFTNKYEKEEQKIAEKVTPNCPYNNEGYDQELAFKNIMDWFLLEVKNPISGKYTVDEYIEDHPNLSEEEKNILLGTKKIIRSEFRVLQKKNGIMRLKDLNTKIEYDVELFIDSPHIIKNVILKTRIHPLGELYKTAGIMKIETNYPFISNTDAIMDMMEEKMIRDAEKVIVTQNSTLTSVLNKYPFQWVDGIYNQLGLISSKVKNEKVKDIFEEIKRNAKTIINKLPEKSKEALKIIITNPGFVKYNELKNYDDEMSFFWNEHTINSTIGLLRLNGLIVIGSMQIYMKKYKVALVPKDTIEEIRKALEENQSLFDANTHLISS